jgi:hypothetical protein
VPHERQANAVLRATESAKIDQRAPTSAIGGGNRPPVAAPTPDARSSMANPWLERTGRRTVRLARACVRPAAQPQTLDDFRNNPADDHP